MCLHVFQWFQMLRKMTIPTIPCSPWMPGRFWWTSCIIGGLWWTQIKLHPDWQGTHNSIKNFVLGGFPDPNGCINFSIWYPLVSHDHYPWDSPKKWLQMVLLLFLLLFPFLLASVLFLFLVNIPFDSIMILLSTEKTSWQQNRINNKIFFYNSIAKIA